MGRVVPDIPHALLTDRVLGSFYAVYHELGFGFLESVYHVALCREMAQRGLHVDSHVPIAVFYKGDVVGRFIADVIVENKIIVELKAGSSITREHESQLINYLRGTAIELGFVLNFGPKAQAKRLIFENRRKIRAPSDRAN
jgi:GxxExxY protein